MAKSIRSKTKQRYRRAKRHLIDGTVHTERINQAHKRVKDSQLGLSIQSARPKNAFLHPEDPEAIFPQKELNKPIDFRSEALPLSGFAVAGCRRQFTDQEKRELNLVVGSKDGLLPSELYELHMRRGKAVQKMTATPEDVSMAAMLDGDNAANEESGLVAGMQRLALGNPDEFCLTAPDQIPTLEDLKKYQDRISGASKKKVVIPRAQANYKNKKQR